MKVGDLGVFNNKQEWTIVDLIGRMFVITEIMDTEHAVRIRMLDDFEEILFDSVEILHYVKFLPEDRKCP
jgi:PII-like signaling protein|tara:strand:+ start:321 stop:530 length:210 start_codon:yes stop_codon:yes gene_type:complete